MIDITPYEQKLLWLKEWIGLKVDGNLPETSSQIQINIDVVSRLSIGEIMQIYNQTGCMFYRATEPSTMNVYHPMNFDQYQEYKQSFTLKQ